MIHVRQHSPERFICEQSEVILELPIEKLTLMCSLELLRISATNDKPYKERLLELLKEVTTKMAGTIMDRPTMVNMEITSGIQVTLNVRSESWELPTEWNKYILHHHHNPDRRTIQQIVFLPQIPTAFLRNLLTIRETDLQIGILNWFRLTAKKELHQKVIENERLTVDEQIKKGEIWISQPTARDFSKVSIFIESRKQYGLWRKQEFKLQINNDTINFTSCAKYKLCDRCLVTFTNTHVSDTCPKKAK